MSARHQVRSADLSWVVGCDGFTTKVSNCVLATTLPILASRNILPSLLYAKCVSAGAALFPACSWEEKEVQQ